MTNESQSLPVISRTALLLLLKKPFYAHVLAGMPSEVSYVKTVSAFVSFVNDDLTPRLEPLDILEPKNTADWTGSSTTTTRETLKDKRLAKHFLEKM